ncbi:1477_t:CDS:1 [Entrophospora sp. SA101]|nr:1477_t:CDS:1 [Entrophospora sp. SA101]CAJ0899581.1 13320_t:CDS:1 [Entrophospora sp. SA101]
MLGDPGLGKSYISEAIGKALGDGKRLSYHRVLMTGKKDGSVIEGGSMENPGGDPGEIIKGISRCQNQSMVFLFDEIEKAGRDAKLAIGEPTDRTNNKKFKDVYFDFPTPINNAIFFCALNYAEELDPFIRDRFKMIEVKPPTYQQRLEILRALLQSKIKSEEEPLNKIYHKTWQEVYNLVNQEAILKKALTKSFSIRGAKDNITTLFRTMRTQFFMKQKALLDANGWANYNWKFDPKEEFDLGNKSRNRPPCPYGEEKDRTGISNKEHRTGCKCFVNNLHRVPG